MAYNQLMSDAAAAVMVNPSTTPTATLPGMLRLPRRVREQIYMCYDLLARDLIFGLDLDGPSAPRMSEEELRCRRTKRLLLICKTVYSEASFLVYANNHVFLTYNRTSSLASLQRLRSTSVTALTHLTVHLHVASCGQGGTCYAMDIPSLDRNTGASSVADAHDHQTDLKVSIERSMYTAGITD